jgi:hypothetical protein
MASMLNGKGVGVAVDVAVGVTDGARVGVRVSVGVGRGVSTSSVGAAWVATGAQPDRVTTTIR